MIDKVSYKGGRNGEECGPQKWARPAVVLGSQKYPARISIEAAP